MYIRLAKKKKKERKFVWKFECVDTEPTPPPSDGGGWTMTVQGISLVTFLFSFSPWLYRHTHTHGWIDRALSLSLIRKKRRESLLCCTVAYCSFFYPFDSRGMTIISITLTLFLVISYERLLDKNLLR
jgi:hypothetical protein